ncbi:MAG: NUDIX hydrolase [Pseudanabaenaceae cyanobacterium bins.68]|nr:NUDIX hydrolase [Pseudanabaenaceae cyanobacterium bins.68]
MTEIIPFELQQQVLYYHGRKFDFRVDRLRLPHGVGGEYSYIQHPGAAIAVPITAEGKFVLVRQYRFPLQRYILEFPAGTLEPNEAPAATMARELAEETGYHAHTWQALGSFYICPGYSDEVIHAYLAQDLAPLAQPPSQDADEEIEVVLLERQVLEEMIRTQPAAQNLDAKSITAFYLAISQLA